MNNMLNSQMTIINVHSVIIKENLKISMKDFEKHAEVHAVNVNRLKQQIYKNTDVQTYSSPMQ